MNTQWGNVKAKSTEDLLQLYDHYIRKFAPEVPGVVVDSVEPTTGASLIVVDMQNDFILPGADLGPGTEKDGKNGRFSVTSGLSVVKPLTEFIKTNGSKFKKIIFTRDAHASKHCSFSTMGGTYPPHCVINHIGAALHPDFLQFKDLENADVVFKGVYTDADSYGGVPYPMNSYRNARQAASGPGCCQGGNCMDGTNDKTGGRYLKDRTRAFEDFPFTGVPEYTADNLANKDVDECPESTYANIKDQLEPTPFPITDLLGGQTEGTHTVFVVGLAGDYCVKDTAINLAKVIKANGGMLNGVRTNVVIIEPFTRYPTLPLSALEWKNQSAYKTIPGEGQNAKNIDAYLFKTTGVKTDKGESIMRRLTKNEALAANLKADKYTLQGFINPIRPILKDYATSGVKLLMTVPTVSGMAGGARRKNKTRKNCWPKPKKGGKRGTRKPMGHKKGCRCIICKRR